MEIYTTEIDIGVQKPSYHAIVHMHDYIDIATNLKSSNWRVRLDEQGQIRECKEWRVVMNQASVMIDSGGFDFYVSEPTYHSIIYLEFGAYVCVCTDLTSMLWSFHRNEVGVSLTHLNNSSSFLSARKEEWL
jgi:hypothetical protein